MSRQQQDASPFAKSRQRANTTSFAPFAWRRNKPDSTTPPPATLSPTAHQSLSLDALIEALQPPAVPSLAYARSLATLLVTASPLPRRAVISSILSSLCDVNGPLSFQVAGFDILSSYWENHEAVGAETADRLSFFSLFLGSTVSWATDLWEPRFKAIRALTKYGADIVGIETALISILKWWIEGAFDGLLRSDTELDRAERTERERSVDVLVKFLSDILKKIDNIARLPENMTFLMVQFYAGLVDRSLVNTEDSNPSDKFLASSESLSSAAQSKSGVGHRRNPSSLSATSLSSPTTPSSSSVQSQSTYRHPAEIAITIYLDYLHTQIRTLSLSIIEDILSVLFRALAFCASPLPRLTLLPHLRKKSSLEDRVMEALDKIYSGPYSTSCMILLKQFLLPKFSADDQYETDSAETSQQESDTDTLRPKPSKIPWEPLQLGILTSLGAFRMLRNCVRRTLVARLARAYILRETSIGYAYSGAPSHIDVEQDLMEKAWPRDEGTVSEAIGIGSAASGWDARRMGKVLAASVAEWVAWIGEGPHNPSVAELDKERLKEFWDRERQSADKILEEAAGLLKDILQEADSRDEDSSDLSEEEAVVVGETLHSLSGYIPPLRNPDGTPFIVTLENPASAPTPLLRSITSLLARDYTSNLGPLLSATLLSIADNLTDKDTARLPVLMLEQHDLSPTSPDWLTNWENLFKNPTVISSYRPLTRRAVMEALAVVFESVEDMKTYRRPLADLVFMFCKKWVGAPVAESEDSDAMWKILGDEIVLRAIEPLEDGQTEIDKVHHIITLLQTIASEPSVEELEDLADTSQTLSSGTQTPPSVAPAPTPSNIVSPLLSRMQSEFHASAKDKEGSTIPSVMSLLSSFASGGVSRSQSSQPPAAEELPEPLADPSPPKSNSIPRAVSAVSAIVNAFSQLSFTPYVLEARLHQLAIRLYLILLEILTQGRSARARVSVLQFLMRLRADRDHNIYFISRNYDGGGLVGMLSGLINRSSLPSTERNIEDPDDDYYEVRKSRPRVPQDREERQGSRGRGTGALSRSAASRSRSRAAARASPELTSTKIREPLWIFPESIPFVVAAVDTPSEALISYDYEGPDRRIVLPISQYLSSIIGILERETSWEVLSYVLCHLPTQLANKHLFCGPLCRPLISRLLNVLCTGILNGELGFYVEAWPPGLKLRDAQGLAHHTLSVLTSYRRCFETNQRHVLVEVFQQGLDGQLSTIKCCLHALTLSAFELQSSMTKYMSRILEKLSQIMSNPNMSVHILGFLSIVGTLPTLYANFTDADYKMVFGVALQYLQHYNRLNASPTMSWALSQYVRIMSYSAVYIWFLRLKLPDRPKHIPYITRQLVLANEGNEVIDGPTEVCFDWLARFAYASADPRPASSAFSEIVMNPSSNLPDSSSSEVLQPIKTWLVGNAVVTIRVLPRMGWVEVLSRRPSGFSKFICRVENVPMVGPGDVLPDISSVPAGLMLERNPQRVAHPGVESVSVTQKTPGEEELQEALTVKDDGSDGPPPPDPITGYVWSKTAPSQRRKDVVVDPSYFVLQLSSYPYGNAGTKKVEDTPALSRFISMLDRIPVIDTHKVGIMYVAPGQTDEHEILSNTHGSPAYTRFLERLGRLINLRGQVDVYAGGLDPDEDGEYAYAWWDDIGQILYHTATMMPSHSHDPNCNFKKRHIGNDYVRIVWNDSGLPYRFDTLTTQFQFVNIVIEPHSLGAIAAFSNNLHENEYFRVNLQRAPGMTEFAPVGNFKLISAENLPLLVRQLSLLADWFAAVFAQTQNDTVRVEMKTNWYARLEAIRRFKSQLPQEEQTESPPGIFAQEASRDFTNLF